MTTADRHTGETYLGIDAGTSVVKAAVFDADGNALAVKG